MKMRSAARVPALHLRVGIAHDGNQRFDLILSQ